MSSFTTLDNNSFYNFANISAEPEDKSSRNMYNTRFVDYMLANFPKDASSSGSGDYVDFATSQSSIMFSGLAHGKGLPGSAIDTDSELLLKSRVERPYEKLQLNKRLYNTVPYLGRGSCDPVLESQLKHGEWTKGLKSAQTISEKTYIDYDTYPIMDSIKEKVNNSSHTIEDSAMSGWIRGGIASRESGNDADFIVGNRA
jgi:hypothetical protein